VWNGIAFVISNFRLDLLAIANLKKARTLTNNKSSKMTDYNKEVEDFKQFASGKIKTHQDELNTRYENENINNNTLEKGYAEHRKLFAQELNEKSNSLLAGKENPWLKEELRNISETFIQQLSLKS
jgi:hypothetical protein